MPPKSLSAFILVRIYSHIKQPLKLLFVFSFFCHIYISCGIPAIRIPRNHILGHILIL